MNYAFKIMGVVIALGVLVLQGCIGGAEIVSRVAVATAQTIYKETKRKKQARRGKNDR